MALGPEPLGAASFIAIKFLGYRHAGIYLNRKYGAAAKPWQFGVVRTLLGIAVGVSFSWTMNHIGIDRARAFWYLFLAPVRLCEWVAVIWYFYERKQEQRRLGRLANESVLGMLWSYLLDLPAVLSVFIVPGAMWVC